MKTRQPLQWLVVLVLAVLAGSPRCSDNPPAADSAYAEARRRMVTTQLEARNITDKRVLKAMMTVERHRFVGKDLQAYAYIDSPLPIGEEQTISQPYIVALMTQLLEIDENDKILEVGTGSGYQAAILAELADSVFTIEIIDKLGRAAKKLLRELGYSNVAVRIGDGYLGWPEEAPFDAVIVTCAPAEIPQPLIDQLAESARMVIPVGTDRQELVLLEKKNGALVEKSIIPVRFVPMTGNGVEQK